MSHPSPTRLPRPKVVLVPGFSQTAASWRGVKRVLEESCTVAALDVPAEPTFAATATAVGTQGERAVYAGYSMGGRLALRLALDRPELVSALILVSSTAGITDEAARRERIASDEALAASVERDGVDAFLERWLAQPLFATVPADAPGLRERRRLSARYLAHCLRVLGAGAMDPMWERLPELQMPVALVTGTTDAKYETIALAMLERMRGEVVHVRLDGGHALPLEQPAVLGGFIASFAARHG
ncbi:MAG: 2-succinyl-6-hydroxy-2,4-cyclohexadiene-carboxylate synthase [Actinomycetota bacterium]|nr:2-succinyl-6-hydroxy-2,4-cyclohexadiene-carboxylate synthase [Actinomycetota bacterium]